MENLPPLEVSRQLRQRVAHYEFMFDSCCLDFSLATLSADRQQLTVPLAVLPIMCDSTGHLSSGFATWLIDSINYIHLLCLNGRIAHVSLQLSLAVERLPMLGE